MNALHRCKYLSWALNRLQADSNSRHNINQAESHHNNHPTNKNRNKKNKNIYMVIPYSIGLNESSKMLALREMLVHFKERNTIKNLPMAPETRIILLRKVG